MKDRHGHCPLLSSDDGTKSYNSASKVHWIVRVCEALNLSNKCPSAVAAKLPKTMHISLSTHNSEGLELGDEVLDFRTEHFPHLVPSRLFCLGQLTAVRAHTPPVLSLHVV